MNQIEKAAIADADDEEYRRHSAALKLRTAMFQGIGSATVFGLIAASTHFLFAAAVPATGAISFLPLLGIGAVVAVGIGCVYFGAKYYAESVRLDNYQQAKKINAGKAVSLRKFNNKPACRHSQPKAMPITMHRMGNILRHARMENRG